MQQIGFINFRRFEKFPTMEIAPITILVGENNAGKSTVVKGILAYSDFLNSKQNFDQMPYYVDREETAEKRKQYIRELLKNIKFPFNTSYLAHIGTFKRALYNQAKDDSITFHTSLGPMDISVQIKGNRDDEEAVSGNVTLIKLYFNTYNLSMSFDLESDSASITFNPNPDFHVDEDMLRDLRMREIEKYFSCFNKPYTVTTNISDNWRPLRNDFILSLVDALESSINATLYPIPKDVLEKTGFGEFQGGYYVNTPIENMDDETKAFLLSLSEIFTTPRYSDRDSRDRFKIPGPRLYILHFVDIEYLYAHAVTQTVIYSAKDTNDYLSRTIHEFASQYRHKHKNKENFIIKWMREFGIGINFSIRSVGGEAHIVKIQNKDGEWVNLADKGMGSIQLMVLLFRLAITLPQMEAERGTRRPYSRKIIIIEEPEQNLHPMLQSKLADLFFELNTKYGFRFIIETHSEYLIRKTQVIVKENFNDEKHPLKDNPFKVYYFNSSDSEKPYYEIIYQKDGSFSNDFGRGFFDEASNLAFEIL